MKAQKQNANHLKVNAIHKSEVFLISAFLLWYLEILSMFHSHSP